MIKITFTFDEDTQKVKTKITPTITKYDETAHNALNALLAGFSKGVTDVLDFFPMLRPATAEEVAHKIYVYKDVEKDEQLFKARAELYHALGSSLKDLLSYLFPDVEYIEGTRVYQQEASLERTEAEHADFLKEVERIADEIRLSIRA